MWANTIIWIIAGICIIAFCVIWFFLNWKKDKIPIEIPDNAPIVTNYWSSKTDGHATGFEIECKTGIKGRKLCKFIPTDIDTTKDKELKVYRIVLKKGMRIPYPRGDLSSNREIVAYFPNSPIDLPKDVINSEAGKTIQDFISKMSLINTSENFLHEGALAQKRILEKYPLGEVSAEALQLIESFNEVVRKSELEKKQEDIKEVKK